MKKTTADLPELAQKAASDKNFRDHLFWSMVTLYPDAFLRLVNGEDMLSYQGPTGCATSGGTITLEPKCLMVDHTGHPLAVDIDLFCKVRDFVIAGKKVDAIKELRAGAGLGLKEAKDFVEGTFPTNRNSY